MSHAYKALFERVNESRKNRGLQTLTWKEFISKDESHHLTKTYREEIYFHVDPDPKVKFVRPSATYDNQSYRSIFEKYGI